ncbi:hypothetical protein O181_047031 [Austropuccinia psidii MF-1]|uniref:Uncharacterized protein n=1 Tax=Austropuccinia psidii MF-1 TaxID=1389203 RepID=A0A9Q3DN23_9BASI|nr:hypothetical protein [Austropuccinia psidii MF-1]
MLSEPEFELSISNSNRDKSHSEGSDRHLYGAVQAVLHSVQGERLGNVATNPPRSDELLAYPEKIPQRQGNSEIIQCMESTIIQASNQKDQGVPCQKQGGNQGRNVNPTNFPKKGRRKEKKIGGNYITQVTGSQKFKKMPWTMSSTWPEL